MVIPPDRLTDSAPGHVVQLVAVQVAIPPVSLTVHLGTWCSWWLCRWFSHHSVALIPESWYCHMQFVNNVMQRRVCIQSMGTRYVSPKLVGSNTVSVVHMGGSVTCWTGLPKHLLRGMLTCCT